jgi:hypothetical protein
LRDAIHWDEVDTNLGLHRVRRHDLRPAGLTWMADAAERRDLGGDRAVHARCPREERLEQSGLSDGLGTIPLGEVSVDEDPMSALPEGIIDDCGQAGLDSRGSESPPGQTRTQALERLETEVAEKLPMLHEPPVVPVGQQGAGIDQPVGVVRRQRRLGNAPAGGEGGDLADVNDNVRAEAHLGTAGVDQARATALDPPQPGSKVA